MLRWALVGLCLAAGLGNGGCYFLQRAKKPMPTQCFTPLGPERARGVVVMLPGFSDGPEDFVENGFVDLIREQAPGYDVVAANAHFNYYRRRNVWHRLEYDVIQPLHAQGYRQVWLVGISMGGFGSLGYTFHHPEQVTGVILLAPYMGPRELIEEIDAAGGLDRWEPGDLEKTGDESDRLFRGIWAWLKRHPQQSDQPELYIGYGREDNLRFPNAMLGRALPRSHVASHPGGHKWTTWRPLFSELIGRALGERSAGEGLAGQGVGGPRAGNAETELEAAR